jgi:hypothetical protein
MSSIFMPLILVIAVVTAILDRDFLYINSSTHRFAPRLCAGRSAILDISALLAPPIAGGD